MPARSASASKRIDTLPPHRRNIGMVFQNYAIFPNLTVAGNVAYGLQGAQGRGAEIAERGSRDALALVRLAGLRRALAAPALRRPAAACRDRARPRDYPEVLLLDEPLSNLDASCGSRCAAKSASCSKRLKITTVYVTHDQEEALAVSDRIAVMQAGRHRAAGRPEDIYRGRANLFVAQFMGTTNVLRALSGRARRDSVRSGGSAPLTISCAGLEAREGEAVSLLLRPEALRIVKVRATPARRDPLASKQP